VVHKTAFYQPLRARKDFKPSLLTLIVMAIGAAFSGPIKISAFYSARIAIRRLIDFIFASKWIFRFVSKARCWLAERNKHIHGPD
jgi:hypothetical protein